MFKIINSRLFSKLYVFSFLPLFIFYSHTTQAWNFQGHQLISEATYSQLSNNEQKKLDTILDKLIKQLPRNDKKLFKKQSYNISKLAKLSIMPDVWKTQKLEDLYKKLNLKHTSIINKVTNNNIKLQTYDWHYKSPIITDLDHSLANTNIDNTKINTSITEGKLDSIINNLYAAIIDQKQNKPINTQINNNQEYLERALAIVFLAHFIQDAHQPLHAMSGPIKKLNENTKNNNIISDKGGNLFCLRLKHKNCSYNLHQYWDSAAGMLNKQQNIKVLVNNTINQYPKDLYKTQITKKNPDTWLAENYNFRHIIYNTPKNKIPNKLYQAKTRAITGERLAVASYRLTEILKEILR